MELASREKKYDDQLACLKTLAVEHSMIEDDPQQRPRHD
jgi:hypothetical protein